MKKILLWPGFLSIGYLLMLLYYFIKPCNSGMFIGGCEMGNLLIAVLLFFNLIIYFLLTLIFLWLNKFNLKKLSIKTLIILVLSSLFILGSLIFSFPDQILYFQFWILLQVEQILKLIKLNNLHLRV